jgi:hypothetical protein
MQVYGAHALVLQDAEGLKTGVWKSLVAGNRPGASPFFFRAPEQVDLTQQGVLFRPLPAKQGWVPASLYGYQTDTSQIGPVVWKSTSTPPAVAGRLSQFFSIPPQADPSQLDPRFQTSLFRVITSPGRLSTFFVSSPQDDPTQIPSLVWYGSQIKTTVKFRKTLSGIGTRVGARQIQGF